MLVGGKANSSRPWFCPCSSCGVEKEAGAGAPFDAAIGVDGNRVGGEDGFEDVGVEVGLVNQEAKVRELVGVEGELGECHGEQGAVVDDPAVRLGNGFEVGQRGSGGGDEDEATVAADGEASVGAHGGAERGFDHFAIPVLDEDGDQGGVGGIGLGEVDDFGERRGGRE